jgi:hypothetical protein
LDASLAQSRIQRMSDRDDFVAWVEGPLRAAEVALHSGDADPRRALWSQRKPVSILGAMRNAYGRQEVEEAFAMLENMFTDCTSFRFEMQAFDVVGDMAFTGSSTRRHR